MESQKKKKKKKGCVVWVGVVILFVLFMPTSDVRTSRPTVHAQWKKGVKAKTTNMYGVDLSSYAELVEVNTNT